MSLCVFWWCSFFLIVSGISVGVRGWSVVGFESVFIFLMIELLCGESRDIGLRMSKIMM